MDAESFEKKVAAVAKYKYEIEEDILENFLEDIEWCFNNGFSAIRTVEYIANQIF